jgi:hypothetical protein
LSRPHSHDDHQPPATPSHRRDRCRPASPWSSRRRRPDDVRAIHDDIPAEKELFWIEGSTRRWDGYRYFAENPGRILDWSDRHLS